MFDAKTLLEQFLGTQPGDASGVGTVRQKFERSALNSFGGGAAVGGVLGLLMGGKNFRKLSGGVLGYGGAAAIGALALRAYQNYQQGKAGSYPVPLDTQQVVSSPPDSLPHAQPAADGAPLELTLMRAMIGAAKADGHIDPGEQERIFDQVEKLGLDPDAKACVFDMLNAPVDPTQLATAARDDAQRAEIYLAARLAGDADHPAERAYLDALASRLRLPAELREHLDGQAAANQSHVTYL